ncbi:MAG: fimbrial protein [Neisseriaceae bacterium]|nr:fimbrial protein [Neisseriaceae bacterium]MBP6861780.1 fimbrial protein [Neisseriaceae bacterium]
MIGNRLSLTFVALGLCLMSSASWARCTGILGHKLTSYDKHTASLSIGRVNILSNYLQPPGSILATGMANYNQIRDGALANMGDESIILTCTENSDHQNLSWVTATNGDSRIGGFYEVPGHPGYFATEFPYVAIELSMVDTGEVFSRYWRKTTVPVQKEDRPGGGFVIRKKHVPKVMAKLMKWGSAFGETRDANGIRVAAAYCHGGATSETHIPTSATGSSEEQWSADYYKVNNHHAGCGQPNGYLHLYGTGGYNVPLDKDSNNNVYAWDRSIAIGLNGPPAATFSYTPSCVLRNNTPYVVFPPVSAQQLKDGESVSRDFQVSVDCDSFMNNTVSVTASAIGIQPSYAAFNQVKQLEAQHPGGFIDPSTKGLKYLVSDNYDAPHMAKGVGITLQNGVNERVNFVSWDGCEAVSSSNTSYCPAYSNLQQMRNAGWDPVRKGSDEIEKNPVMGTVSYIKYYTATLTQLPNIEPTPGQVKATATIMVRLP